MAKNKMSFEEAIDKLEQTVKLMESGELPLTNLLAHFEEGIGLLRHCQDELSDVEAKIEVLTNKDKVAVIKEEDIDIVEEKLAKVKEEKENSLFD